MGFNTGDWPSATPPVLLLQSLLTEAYGQLRARLAAEDPGRAELLPATAEELLRPGNLPAATLLLRGLLADDASLRQRLVDGKPLPAPEVRLLAQTYAGPASHYFNHYGPPGSFRTVGFERILAEPGEPGYLPPAEIRGKVVILGADYGEFESAENNRTALVTSTRGVPGAELLATAYANLRSGETLEPQRTLGAALLLAAVPLALSACSYARRLRGALALMSALALGYLLLTEALFAWANILLPMALPVLLQVPAVAVPYTATHYRRMQQESASLRRLFGTRPVPASVVAHQIRVKEALASGPESLFGVSLMTDIEGYTTMGEQMDPQRFKALMQEYFEATFPPIEAGQGEISEIRGDSTLALWAAPADDPKIRRRACPAGLEILAAVEEFNARTPLTKLPTLIGVNCGELSLGMVGAGRHQVFQPVGDSVNAAQRLQRLNKLLGTRVSASRAVVEGLAGISVREVGSFRLRGRVTPMEVF